MISPKKVMEDIKQVRKEIRYNYGNPDVGLSPSSCHR